MCLQVIMVRSRVSIVISIAPSYNKASPAFGFQCVAGRGTFVSHEVSVTRRRRRRTHLPQHNLERNRKNGSMKRQHKADESTQRSKEVLRRKRGVTSQVEQAEGGCAETLLAISRVGNGLCPPFHATLPVADSMDSHVNKLPIDPRSPTTKEALKDSSCVAPVETSASGDASSSLVSGFTSTNTDPSDNTKIHPCKQKRGRKPMYVPDDAANMTAEEIVQWRKEERRKRNLAMAKSSKEEVQHRLNYLKKERNHFKRAYFDVQQQLKEAMQQNNDVCNVSETQL